MSCWIGVLVWFWVCFFGGVWRNRFPCTLSLDFFNWLGEEWNASITKSQWSRAGTPSMRKPAPREIISASVQLCGDWCLFLEHPTYWYECMTSKYAQKSSRGWFWVFKISGKARVLKTVPTCIVVLYFPHDNIVRIHIVWWMYEIKRAKRLSHALVHLVTARASLFTVHTMSGLPNARQLQTFEDNLRANFWQLSNRSHFFFLKSDGRQGMEELRLWKAVELFCSPVRKIVPLISLHDLPHHRTMRTCSRQVSQNKVVFQYLLQRFWIQTYFCICPQYLCLFDILFECNPNKRGQGMMSGRPKSTSFRSTFHIESMFCFFPANLMSSTYTDKNSPFLGLRMNMPKLELFPVRIPRELSRIVFPIVVLPKDDRTDFAQDERLDLPYWTTIWAVCVSVDVSIYLDILTLEFAITMEHLPS